jgi:hypothetical protein
MSAEMPGLKRLTLQRLHEDAEKTLGAIYDEKGRRVCVTLELPDCGNKENVSRFPAGEYIAERRHSETHHGVVFGLLYVPGRRDIELHIGCLPRDTKGCVLLGQDYGHVDYEDGTPDGKGDGIIRSRTAFLSFMADHPEQRFWLHVVDPSPSLPEHPL